MKVGRVLLCALPQEGKALLELLEQPQRVSTPPIAPHASATRGVLNGDNVAVVVSGEGATRSAQAMVWIDQEFEGVPLVSFGVAGGLSPGLELGELLWASQVATHEGEPDSLPSVLELPTGLGESELERLRTTARPAVFLTVPVPVTEPSERSRRLEEVGRALGISGDRAESLTACVEMECYPIARSCAASGRPLLMLRSISDTAEQPLPSLLRRYRTTDGATDVPRLALAALVRPPTWQLLARLRSRVARESARLARLLADC